MKDGIVDWTELRYSFTKREALIMPRLHFSARRASTEQDDIIIILEYDTYRR